jgi:hypothetical protein
MFPDLKEKDWYPTPTSLLPLIADLIDNPNCAMLDPCAGDGATMKYLASRWRCSKYGVEIDDSRYEELLHTTNKAINERFQDIVADGFGVIYCYPPPQTRAHVSWIKNVAKASAKGKGVVIWRLTKKVLLRPTAIEAFTEYFKDWELFKDPPETWDDANHFTIRARRKEHEEEGTTQGECFDFAQAIVEAPVLGADIPEAWDVPYIYGGNTFRRRGLEWEDVYPELMETFRNIRVPETGEQITLKAVDDWFKELEETGRYPEIPDPDTVSGWGSCWSIGWFYTDGGFYLVTLVGRKTAVHSVEAAIKDAKGIRFGQYGGKKIKPLGLITGVKEDFTVIKKVLPNTGAHAHIWIHKQCTSRADRGSVFIMNGSDEEKAKMISNVAGFPVAPEWAEYLESRIKSSSGWRNKVLGTYAYIDRRKISEYLAAEAKQGKLVEPWIRDPEIIRPIMPPSVGIWAQFAMQEFVNGTPLPGGMMMHAEPIKIKDRDSEVRFDGKIETTTLIRKDAVRITVFHYTGDRAGEIEVFETERLADA